MREKIIDKSDLWFFCHSLSGQAFLPAPAKVVLMIRIMMINDHGHYDYDYDGDGYDDDH